MEGPGFLVSQKEKKHNVLVFIPQQLGPYNRKSETLVLRLLLLLLLFRKALDPRENSKTDAN